MRRLLLIPLVTVLGVIGLQELADSTRNEGDRHVPGTSSEVVLDVRTRGGTDPTMAATSLWAVCHMTVPAVDLVDPPTEVATVREGARFTLTVSPALGEHDRKRLRGCLADGTVDRVWADVVSLG